MPIKSVVFGPSGFAPSAMIVGDDHIDVGAYAVPPADVTGLSVASDTVYEAAPGRWVAQMQLSWAPVTLNRDGSVCDDLAGYELAWKLHSSSTWSAAGSIDPLLSTAYLSGFPLNTVVDFRIRAFDNSGNYSNWTELDSHTTSKDTQGPNAPSTPAVTSLFGAIRAQWDGKDSAGAAMPSDFDHITVHWGTTAGFVPSAANQVDVIADRNGGASLIADPDYVTPYFVKFVAYDTYGNPSAAPSAASAQVIARQGVDADFANVSATKLIAGVITATVGISSGKLQIGVMDVNGNLVNPTGARIVIDSSGIKAWNGSNVNTVSIGSDGNASFTGSINSGSSISGATINGGAVIGASIKTAATGPRIEITGQYYNQILGYSGESHETQQGSLMIGTYGPAGPTVQLITQLTSGALSSHDFAYLQAISASTDNSYPSQAAMQAGAHVMTVKGTFASAMDESGFKYMRMFNTAINTGMDGGEQGAPINSTGIANYTHRLGITPNSIQCTLNDASAHEVRLTSKSALGFSCHFTTASGALPANGTTITIDYLAAA